MFETCKKLQRQLRVLEYAEKDKEYLFADKATRRYIEKQKEKIKKKLQKKCR